MLLMLAAEVLALLHSTYYSWSSHLLGAFLAGLSWSTYAPVKELWAQQAGQPVAWLTRLFFAATIGFEVPVRDFWTTKVIGRAAIMAAASLGKLVAGVYALPSRVRLPPYAPGSLGALGCEDDPHHNEDNRSSVNRRCCCDNEDAHDVVRII